jgi:hypothetical protein
MLDSARLSPGRSDSVLLRMTTARPTFRWRDPKPVEPPPFLKFMPVMRAGLEAAPQRADLKLQLARALFHIDCNAEIVERLGPRLVDEDDPELYYYVGRAALATGDHRLACDSLGEAAARGFSPAFGHLAEALERVDRRDEALAAALQRLTAAPSDYTSLRVAARVLLGRGEAERLWSLSVELRARGASGSWFLALTAAGAAALGREDEFRALIDPERWFSATQLPVADGVNQGLAAELLALRSSAAEIRIDRLEALGGRITQQLLGKIRTAVEAYVEDRRGFTDHPLIAAEPAAAELHSWAIYVHDHQHHGWHIHGAGWISGVYYVAVPQPEPADPSHPGAIEFGPYPFDRAEENFRALRWHLTPQPGLLLLFPSYYGHRTWPTGVADLRISIPFDVRQSAPGSGAQ